MAYALIRYRYRKEARAAYEPENKKLEWWLLVLTTVGVAAMLAPGLFVWAKFVDVPEDAAVVEAVGQQWNWSYRLPGEDGKLGTVDSRHVSDENPFGMNPGDANGQDDVLVASPELHLPIGKPIKLLLRSKDVLHNFSVAEIRVQDGSGTGHGHAISGSRPRAPGSSISCAKSCAASGISPCAGKWSWKRPTPSRRGCAAIRRMRRYELDPPAMPLPARRSMPCALPAMARKAREIRR